MRKFLIGALALVLLGLAPSAASATLLPSDCRAGSYLVGFHVMAGDYIDKIAGVCAAYRPETGGLAEAKDQDFLPSTSHGGSPQRQVCPDDSVITGTTYNNPLISGQTVIEHLEFTCRYISAGHEIAGTRLIQTHGDRQDDSAKSDTTPHAQFNTVMNGGCKSDEAVTGYSANIGEYITILGIHCNPWPRPLLRAEREAAKRINADIDQQARDVALAKAINNHMKPGQGSSTGGFSKIEGMWRTTQGTMQLTQSTATIVSGTYHPGGGQVSMQLAADGTLQGIWSQVKSDKACPGPPQLSSQYWGRLTFRFNSLKTHFDGTWSYCGANPGSSARWSGDRVP